MRYVSVRTDVVEGYSGVRYVSVRTDVVEGYSGVRYVSVRADVVEGYRGMRYDSIRTYTASVFSHVFGNVKKVNHEFTMETNVTFKHQAK